MDYTKTIKRLMTDILDKGIKIYNTRGIFYRICYMPPNNTIYINLSEPNKEMLCYQMLHEYGHAIDFHNGELPRDPWSLSAIERVNSEFSAWYNGGIVAKKLKVKVGPMFVSYAQVCLRKYGKAYGLA